MNTMCKGTIITSEQIAHWLDAANDEEFGEAIVWFWKKYCGNYEELCREDFKNFDIDRFITWIQDILYNTVPMDSEFNTTAWWKEGGKAHATDTCRWRRL